MNKAIGINCLESLEVKDLYNFVKEFSLYEDIDEMIIYYKDYDDEEINNKALEVSKILTKATTIYYGFDFDINTLELSEEEKVFIKFDEEYEIISVDIDILLVILEMLESMIDNGDVTCGIDEFIDKKVGKNLFDSRNLCWVNEIKNPLFKRTYETIR